jgi:O-6-methylguanine DNA methyltransferase
MGFPGDTQVSMSLDPPRPLRTLARLRIELPRVGALELRATERGLAALHFVSQAAVAGGGGIELDVAEDDLAGSPGRALGAAHGHLARAREAIETYAEGRPWKVEPQLDLTGTTAFRLRVYHRLLRVPFGGVISYGELSRDLGMGLAAARAVGQAVGANPVGIFIPCHRVIRSDGALGGFSGGLDRKVQLLEIEGRTVSLPHPESPVGTEVLDLFSTARPI